MSAITRPMRSRAGPARDCRPNSNGKSRQRAAEVQGNTLQTGALRPRRAEPSQTDAPRQLFGDVWEWTQSAYLPYPGYRPPAGAIGEYNGKFMVSQQVLRGASCVTPEGHSRATYRNFFYPHQRWQFLGLRLASEIE